MTMKGPNYTDRDTERFIRQQCAAFGINLPDELKNKPWITDEELAEQAAVVEATRKAAELAVERVAFIREAAIRRLAAYNDVVAAWQRARDLWDSKPDDC